MFAKIKVLLIAIILVLCAGNSYAQIAFDASADGGTSFITSLTWSHTTSGSNRILWVEVAVISDATGTQDPASGTRTVTYNGVAATEVDHSSQGVGAFSQASFLFVLAAPATGANNIVVSTSITPFAILGLSASYTGAAGTVNQFGNGTTTGTSYTLSVTPSIANCWTIFAMKAAGSETAGAGSNLVVTNTNGTGIFDSNGTIASGAPYLMNVIASSGRFDGVIASFSPAGSPPPATTLPSITLLGAGR